MVEYPFNRTFLERHDRAREVVTLTGQVLTDKSPDGIRKYEFRDDYPIRFHLEELTTCVWYLLRDSGRKYAEVVQAAILFRNELWRQTEKEQAATEELAAADAESNDGIWDESASEETGPYEETGVPPLRTWAVYSDIQGLMDCMDEAFFGGSEWQSSRPWSWPELYLVVSLWDIDEAAYLLNKGEVAKAALWALRAQRHYGYALSDKWMQASEKSYRSAAARKAATKRHEENREMKSQVFEWCSQNLEKSRSLDSAASEIAGKLVPVEWRTVRKWITEYRKSLPSARTV